MTKLSMDELSRVNGGTLNTGWQSMAYEWLYNAGRNEVNKYEFLGDIRERWNTYYGPMISDDCSQEDMETVVNFIDYHS